MTEHMPAFNPTYRSLYFVGDSHGLIFRDQSFVEPLSNDSFVIKHSYIPGLNANNVFDENSKVLNNDLYQYLKINSLMGEGGKARWNRCDGLHTAVAVATKQTQTAPPIVLFCGELTLRENIFRQLSDHYLLLDDGSLTPKDSDHDEAGQIWPAELINDWLADEFSALIAGLIHIRRSGLVNINLAALPLPTADDETFSAMNGFACPFELRLAFTQRVNHYLRQICQQQSIGFIDISAAILAEENWQTQYHLDGVHLSKKSAPMFVNELFHRLYNNTCYFVNRSRYQYLEAQAKAHYAVLPVDGWRHERETFTTQGIVTRCIDSGPEAVLMDKLDKAFVADLSVANKHLSLDWCGNNIEPFSDKINTMMVDESFLAQAHQLIFGGWIAQWVEQCLGHQISIANVRPVESQAWPAKEGAPGEPQAMHYDGCPAGVYRLIVYLTDVDCAEDGAFQYQSVEDDSLITMTGKAGTVLFFDANKILHQGHPPRTQKRRVLDFVVTPALADAPHLMLSAGMNNWPADPYHFTLKGIRSYPEMAGTLFDQHRSLYEYVISTAKDVMAS